MAGVPKTTEFAAGEVICKEGDPGGDLLVIESGIAEVYRTRDGVDVRLAQLSEGEIIGVMTAFGEPSRQASVRAKTVLIAKHIPQERVRGLVKSIPTWANALINDLVLRVKQADEMFVDLKLATGDSFGTGRFLGIAVKLAESFEPVAELLAQGDNKTVMLDDVLKKLAEVVNESVNDLQKIITIFKKHAILPLGSEKGRKVCGMDDLDGMSYFVAFTRNAKKDEQLEEILSALALGDRQALREMFMIAKRLKKDLNAEVAVSFSQIQSRLDGVKFDPHTFKTAEHFGFLRVEKTKGENTVVYNPSKLARIVKVVDAIHEIDGLEAPVSQMRKKRTLVY